MNPLALEVAAATLASASAGNHNLSTGPKRMAVTKAVLGQPDLRECASFPINRDNVI